MDTVEVRGSEMADHNPMAGHNGMEDHMPGMTGGHGNMTGQMHMMMMYFNFDLSFYVLFFGWKIDNGGQLAGSCIGVVLMAILYEGLKCLRQYLHRLAARNKCVGGCKPTSNGTSNDTIIQSPEPGILKKMFNVWHLLNSLLLIIQTTLGMFLMLIYMTFNVWLAISVSLGSGLGYFLFSWDKQSSSALEENHCI